MALAESPLPLFQRGDWPGPVSFRRGWARAEARPWNDAVPDASLRLIRGGRVFLRDATTRLRDLGATATISAPVPQAGRRVWEEAGYEEFARLSLLRLDLQRSLCCPDHLVVIDEPPDVEGLLAIDRAAFPEFWRFDEHGLRESLAATRRTEVLVIRDGDGAPAGYAIIGYGQAITYLQRVAVHPRWQGNGMGSSLVRAAARRARSSGAQAMLLNTQPDNEPAIRLYEREGFEPLPDPLTLLRST